MPVVKSDVQVKSDVLEELKWNPRVDEADVGVEVNSGVVTLTGTVSSYATRLAAREAAHRVSGVLDVADDIQVKVPSFSRLNDTDCSGCSWRPHLGRARAGGAHPFDRDGRARHPRGRGQ